MKTIKVTTIMLMLMVSTIALAKGVQVQFRVEGQCGDCKERIELALDKPGISYANWDVESKILTVKFNNKKYSEDDIHKMVSDLGYATSKHKANTAAQQNLPKCCQPGGH